MTFEILFYGTFFLMLIMTGSIIMVNQNKSFKTHYAQLMMQTKHLESKVFKDIRMGQISRHVSGMGKDYLYLGDTADIHLFEDFIVLFRRQEFVVDINYKPIIITNDPINIRKKYSFGDVYKPKKVLFRTTVRGEVIITLTNKRYNTTEDIITLKKLSIEQSEQLSKIKQWSEILG
jgi:hypothetical protein